MALNSGNILLVMILFAILIAVSIIDIRTHRIPDKLIMVVFLCGCLSIFFMPDDTLLERVIGVFSVSVPMLLLTVLIPGAFGGGDIKLMAALGLFLGWKLCIVAFALAVLTGGGFGIYLLIAKQKGQGSRFAFGPFLSAGTALALLWGNEVIRWYLGILH